MRSMLLGCAALVAAVPAAAQVAPATVPATAPAAPSACTTPAHRAFDFWVGEWTVSDAAGQRVLGRSRIALEEGGCLIHERWQGEGPSGATGQSLNAWDAARREWTQAWVGSDGLVLLLRGGLRSGAMVLEGERPARGGGRQRDRISWTPLPDGRVRQFWEVSTDDGATWSASFDGYYARRP